MQVRSRAFGKDNVTGNDHILHRIGNAWKIPFLRLVSLIHAAAVYHIDIFTVRKHRNVSSRRDLHCFLVKLGIHHGLSVLADGRNSGIHHPVDIRQFFSHHTLCDRAYLKHMDQRMLSRLVFHIIDTVRIVNDRFCVRHCKHRCHTTLGCRHRTGDDILLMGQARISEMHMHIDQTRHYITACRVDHFRGAVRNLLLNLGDPAVLDQHVTDLVQPAVRIDDMSVFNQDTHNFVFLVSAYDLLTD